MVVINSGENYQWMLHPTGCKYVGEQDIYSLKVSTQRVYINYKEPKIALQRENRHHLNQIINVNINNNETNRHHVPPDVMHSKYNITYVVFLPKLFKLNQTIRTKQLNGWPEFSKSIIVMND